MSSLVLAAARTGELVSVAEAPQINGFHGDHRKWLVSYLLGATCGSECRGKLVNAMLTNYLDAGGDYDEPFRRLLLSPRAQAAATFAHLHTRLLWCQVAAEAQSEFRDRVLLPVLTAALSEPKTDAAGLEDLVGLIALVPEPPVSDLPATTAWKKLSDQLEHSKEHLSRTYNTRRAASARERSSPPPAMRKVSFCGPDGTPPAAADATNTGAGPAGRCRISERAFLVARSSLSASRAVGRPPARWREVAIRRACRHDGLMLAFVRQA